MQPHGLLLGSVVCYWCVSIDVMELDAFKDTRALRSSELELKVQWLRTWEESPPEGNQSDEAQTAAAAAAAANRLWFRQKRL